MPKVKITAIEHLRYEKIVEVTEDELIDLELSAHDAYPDKADFGLTDGDAGSIGLESIEIEIVPEDELDVVAVIKAMQQEEPNVYFMDGSSMTGAEAWNKCLQVLLKKLE